MKESLTVTFLADQETCTDINIPWKRQWSKLRNKLCSVMFILLTVLFFGFDYSTVDYDDILYAAILLIHHHCVEKALMVITDIQKASAYLCIHSYDQVACCSSLRYVTSLVEFNMV